jgi:hypothetical protein
MKEIFNISNTELFSSNKTFQRKLRILNKTICLGFFYEEIGNKCKRFSFLIKTFKNETEMLNHEIKIIMLGLQIWKYNDNIRIGTIKRKKVLQKIV